MFLGESHDPELKRNRLSQASIYFPKNAIDRKVFAYSAWSFSVSWFSAFFFNSWKGTNWSTTQQTVL